MSRKKCTAGPSEGQATVNIDDPLEITPGAEEVAPDSQVQEVDLALEVASLRVQIRTLVDQHEAEVHRLAAEHEGVKIERRQLVDAFELAERRIDNLSSELERVTKHNHAMEAAIRRAKTAVLCQHLKGLVVADDAGKAAVMGAIVDAITPVLDFF
jgi:chromosome segregation ATPase